MIRPVLSVHPPLWRKVPYKNVKFVVILPGNCSGYDIFDLVGLFIRESTLWEFNWQRKKKNWFKSSPREGPDHSDSHTTFWMIKLWLSYGSLNRPSIKRKKRVQFFRILNMSCPKWHRSGLWSMKFTEYVWHFSWDETLPLSAVRNQLWF